MEEINVLDSRLKALEKMCENYYNYDNIVYELHPLLTEFIGQDHILFRNLQGIIQSNDSEYTKCKQLQATINAFRVIITLKAKEKKYQVFISSTYRDLVCYRKIIFDELTCCGHIAAGMEDFTACGEDLETYIKRVID